MPDDRKRCPRCAKRGEDTSGDNLVWLDENEFWRCFACGYTEDTEGVPRKKKKKKAAEIPENLIQVVSWKEKGIKLDTLLSWGVFGLYDRPDKWNGTLVFPHKGLDGSLTGIQYRNTTTPEKKFRYVGKVEFFGLHMFDKKTHTEVILWEGATDRMSGWEEDPFKLHLGVPGVNNIETCIQQNAMFLRSFDRIYIAFDNDTAGREWADFAAEMLPVYKTRIVSWPDKVKDFNELHQKKPGQLQFHLSNSHPVQGDYLVTGETLQSSFEEYALEQSKHEGFDTGFEKLNELIGGQLDRGEVLTIVGETGTGKSTFTANVAYNVATLNNTRVLWVGTEMLHNLMLRKFLEIHLEKRIRRIPRSGLDVNDEELGEALAFLTNKFVFFNNIVPSFDVVEEAMITAIHQYDVGLIVVDVLQDIDSDFSEWREGTKIMQQLVALSQGDYEDRRPPVAIILVSHTIGNDGDPITTARIRGGGAVKQKSTCIVAFEGKVSKTERILSLLKKSRMNDSDSNDVVEVLYDQRKRRYREEVPEPHREGGRRRSRRRVGVRGDKNPPRE